ncbi:MAG: nucleotide sugar dehydrogenase, partial [Nitrososphaeraceae archaeon]
MKSGGNRDVPNTLVQSDVTLEPFDSIIRKFKSGEYIVSVYGLGHVGAPIASAWLRSGMSVIGIDKSAKVLENTRRGITHIPE